MRTTPWQHNFWQPRIDDLPSVRFSPSHLIRRRAGFTLLEMLVVMLIIAVLAGVSLTAARPHLDRARLQRFIDAVETADRREREASMKSPFPGELLVNVDAGHLRFKLSQRRIKAPEGWAVSSMQRHPSALIPRAGRSRDSDATTDGAIGRVWYSADGQSNTYAIGLKNRNATGASPTTHWLTVLGMSGQVLHTQDTALANEILNLR